MESPSVIKEDFLHYVWKTRQFRLSDLKLVDGRRLSILNFGNHNYDAGPDFSQGLIEIEGIQWAGNVEIHVSSSQWNRHGHQEDPAYDNVILHVVLEDDAPVKRKDGSMIPTLELNELIYPDLLKNYGRLISSTGWIPCQNLIHKANPFRVEMWFNKIGIERLERKTIEIEQWLTQVNQDWEQLCFIMLSRYLGAKVNTLPMELMARQCELKDLAKNRDNLKSIEAILYGLSGLLDSDYKDDYPRGLKQEFDFFQKKYALKHINPVAWKFSKMRPSNFPTIRIAQLADIIHKNHFLFRAFIEATEIEAVKKLLQCQASTYWDNHYRFDKESPRNHPKKLSKTWMEMLVINVVSPLLFVYGNHTGDQDLKDKAVTFLESITPEMNTVINHWKELGIECKNALQTQGAIRLKNIYCNETHCMSCSIGYELIKS